MSAINGRIIRSEDPPGRSSVNGGLSGMNRRFLNGQEDVFAFRYPGLSRAVYASLIGYWDYRDLGSVARWADQRVGGDTNDLVQVTATKQPSNGVLCKVFDGVDDLLRQEADASVTLTYAESMGSGIQVADNANIDFGTGNFTLVWKGSLPDWIQTENAKRLIGKYQTLADRWQFSVNATTGYINYLHRVTAGTDVTVNTTTAPTLVDGTVAEIVSVITRETAGVAGSVAFYVDGVLFETVAISAGTPANINNTGALQVAGNPLAAAIRVASRTSFVTTYNRALTAAQVLALYTTGEIDPSDQWGSQTAIYTSNFSAGVDGFSATQIVQAGNIDTITDGVTSKDDVLRGYATAVSGYHYWLNANNVALAYKRCKVSLSYYIPSANTNLNRFSIEVYGKSAVGANVQSVTGTWTDIVVYPAEAFSGATDEQRLIFRMGTASAYSNWAGENAVGDDLIYFKDVVITETGATLALEGEGIRADKWYDSSTNNLDASYPAEGATINLEPTPNFNLAGSFTYWEWLKPSDGQPATDNVIFAKASYALPNYSYSLKLKTTGKLELIVSSDGTTATGKVTDAAVYANGAQASFNMIAVVYDATAQTVTFYNNGSAVASSNTAGGGPPATLNDSMMLFTLGASSTPSLYFAGSKSGGGLMSRALTAAEIALMYEQERGRFGL